jgi:DNA polymerase-1
VGWEPPTITIVDTVQDAVQAIRELGKYDEMTIDIEVGIDSETHFGHPEQYKMLCIGISYKPGFVVVFGERACQEDLFIGAFAQLLRAKKWVCHNGKFDIAGLLGYTGYEGRLYFDTMLASYVLDERPGTHGLKYLATELLGAPSYAEEISRYVGKGDSYAIVPRDVLYKYNGYDAHCTMLLYQQYKEQLDEEGRRLHDFLVRSSPALMHTEMEGIKIDQAYSEELVEHYLGVLDPLEKELNQWVMNPRSPKQVTEALADLGHHVSSTDEEHLNNILQKVPHDSDTAKFVQLMLRHRREQKLYGTYVKGIRKRLYRGRIHSTFLEHGTTTGRLASRNPNLFNIPRESSIRRQFVPDEGNVFVQGDYRTVELRVMAVEASDEFLAGIFRQDRDIHDEFSLVFYGPGFTKDQRVRTKAFVYGVPYGREAFSIAQEHGISVQEAQAKMEMLFEAMPGVVKWRQDVKDQILAEGEDLVTRFGRHRRFWLITNDNAKDVVKEGTAFIPQSTAADIQQHAFNKLRLDLHLSTRVSVYDSILVECASADAPDVASTMVRVMEETAAELMGDDIPFPVDIKYGNSWGEV